jgi:hypothetical protein
VRVGFVGCRVAIAARIAYIKQLLHSSVVPRLPRHLRCMTCATIRRCFVCLKFDFWCTLVLLSGNIAQVDLCSCLVSDSGVGTWARHPDSHLCKFQLLVRMWMEGVAGFGIRGRMRATGQHNLGLSESRACGHLE